MDAFVVADGTGRAERAALGAVITVQTILRVARDRRSAPPAEALQAGFSAAKRRMDELPEHDAIGTYVHAAAGILWRGTLTVAWVGDRRAYVLRDGLLTCLTKDQVWMGGRCWLPHRGSHTSADGRIADHMSPGLGGPP